MKSLRNSVHLIGNLGADPQIKQTGTGKSVARLSLATSEKFTSADGKKSESTQWHNLVAWGNLAKISEQYLKKGSEVAVMGRLNYRSYKDNDGAKRYVTEIVVNELLMLGARRKEEN